VIVGHSYSRPIWYAWLEVVMWRDVRAASEIVRLCEQTILWNSSNHRLLHVAVIEEGVVKEVSWIEMACATDAPCTGAIIQPPTAAGLFVLWILYFSQIAAVRVTSSDTFDDWAYFNTDTDVRTSAAPTSLLRGPYTPLTIKSMSNLNVIAYTIFSKLHRWD
jgi:hypothetical protein